MDIKDPDVRRAVETIIDEFEQLEHSIKNKDEEIFDFERENQKLKDTVDELECKVKDLEEALAEAYLTDEADSGRKGEADQDKLSCGRSPDVSDTADNKVAD